MHEAQPDFRRVALGGARRLLVVDARRDERGAVLGQRACDQRLEVGLVRRPGALLKARALRDRDQVDCVRGELTLRAGDLVHPVVPDDDREVKGEANEGGR